MAIILYSCSHIAVLNSLWFGDVIEKVRSHSCQQYISSLSSSICWKGPYFTRLIHLCTVQCACSSLFCFLYISIIAKLFSYQFTTLIMASLIFFWWLCIRWKTYHWRTPDMQSKAKAAVGMATWFFANTHIQYTRTSTLVSLYSLAFCQ